MPCISSEHKVHARNHITQTNLKFQSFIYIGFSFLIEVSLDVFGLKVNLKVMGFFHMPIFILLGLVLNHISFGSFVTYFCALCNSNGCF